MYSSNLNINNFIIAYKNWKYSEACDRARNTLESAHEAATDYDALVKAEKRLSNEEYETAIRLSKSVL
jgi:hypothetical protein